MAPQWLAPRNFSAARPRLFAAITLAPGGSKCEAYRANTPIYL